MPTSPRNNTSPDSGGGNKILQRLCSLAFARTPQAQKEEACGEHHRKEEDSKQTRVMATTSRGTPRSRRRGLEDKPCKDMQKKKPGKQRGRRRRDSGNQKSKVKFEGPPPKQEEEGKSWTTVTPEENRGGGNLRHKTQGSWVPPPRDTRPIATLVLLLLLL